MIWLVRLLWFHLFNWYLSARTLDKHTKCHKPTVLTLDLTLDNAPHPSKSVNPTHWFKPSWNPSLSSLSNQHQVINRRSTLSIQSKTKRRIWMKHHLVSTMKWYYCRLCWFDHQHHPQQHSLQYSKQIILHCLQCILSFKQRMYYVHYLNSIHKHTHNKNI